ncbi:P-loop containing nucleoside triphosphate hydrolase protein [Xylona heveae TC161]|uniref:p-loop containing nucleoside triphosphate hydrolase protein n=1 Tax=Xylona heveae (strain CBS 132557 / TC161) TaxID=1328760 RepID=A0A165IUF5_XYLHT|nr:P-loop containing nucleoside triphosphate hydrolase protein [Xylona heveae TC161]KZF25404.1 P-loop containing nucleoside triphosphate hydrolase protein [Xylona heveae TC161]
MSPFVDDKSPHCIPFILERLKLHQRKYGGDQHPPPFFVGINGIQGVGKTTLVSALCSTLRSPPYNLPTVVLSIDDFYLPHEEQLELARHHPQNPLIQHRGEPGTHDLVLAQSTFQALAEQKFTKIPSYDKSAFDGQGDRTDPSTWAQVNRAGENPVQVIIFEGWCVAFRAIPSSELKAKWEDAVRRAAKNEGQGTLGKHQLNNLEFVNERLKDYDHLTDQLDALIHLDATDTRFVYDWRLQQEAALRLSKGVGMTDEEVIKFVDGCNDSD